MASSEEPWHHVLQNHLLCVILCLRLDRMCMLYIHVSSCACEAVYAMNLIQ